jgi:amino-acid N-acetyltransferase
VTTKPTTSGATKTNRLETVLAWGAGSPCTIEPARHGDEPAITALLREAGLPSEDFVPHLAHFLVARAARGEVIGAIGAEVCPPDALLRSLVVAPAQRGRGIGQKLLEALERAAAEWSVTCWWLLTTTAETFFAARGFRPCPRSSVPAGIAATEEFRGLCPSVATCLSRKRRSS